MPESEDRQSPIVLLAVLAAMLVVYSAPLVALAILGARWCSRSM